MKKNIAVRAVAAVALLAVIILTLVSLLTGSHSVFTQVTGLLFGFMLFGELSLVCSLL